MQHIEDTDDDLLGGVRAALEVHGSVIVRRVPDDRAQLKIAGVLGSLVAPGVDMAPGAHDGKLYSVEVRDGGRGILDQHGHVVLSTTNLAFPLHTDAYNRETPPRYVLLLRVDTGHDTTTSHVADLRDAMSQLAVEDRPLLAQSLYASALGHIPLVNQVGNPVETCRRFNREEITRWGERDRRMGADAHRVVRELSEHLANSCENFVLGHGDCLILDNWRVCHGRGSMPADSPRRLRRAWVA